MLLGFLLDRRVDERLFRTGVLLLVLVFGVVLVL
jgi:hypothetical protein